MKVVYLVAGAGGMYCGSCMRDNRMVATMLRQSRDVALIPLYTPIRTDEPDVSLPHVYYGGISVYLAQESALFRRFAKPFGRLLNLPFLLRMAGRLASRTRPADLGALTVSVLRGEHGHQRAELDQLVKDLTRMRPALVHLPNLMFTGMARAMRQALGIPILCSLAGEDIFLDALPQPFQAEAFSLVHEGAAHVSGFAAPTQYYARHAAAHFKLPPVPIHVVPLGIDPINNERKQKMTAGQASEPPTIGYLARICPEKGLATLCEAFQRLREQGRRCRLRIAGYLGAADRGYLRRVLAHLNRAGWGGDCTYIGEVTRAQKFEFLQSLDMFSVPTQYHEAKGIYLLEAMACGVPVVQPAHGSFPELIEETGGGLLYEPDDNDGLTRALAKLMDDAPLRAELGRAGREAVLRKFTSDEMAQSLWRVYERHVYKRVQPDRDAQGERMPP